jgi:hypothetical protein
MSNRVSFSWQNFYAWLYFDNLKYSFSLTTIPAIQYSQGPITSPALCQTLERVNEAFVDTLDHIILMWYTKYSLVASF